MNTAIVIFAHGSSVESANQPVRELAVRLARRGGYPMVEAAFLELAEPDLGEAVRRVVNDGARRILVVPYFLTLGIHLQRDLPRLLTELARIHPGVMIEATPPMEGHAALEEIVLERARQALGDAS